MENQIINRPTESLLAELFDSWEILVRLTENLPRSQRVAMENQIGRIRDIEDEFQIRYAIEALRSTEMIGQLSAHGARLQALFMRVGEICAANNLRDSKPVIETAHEYLEAWYDRNTPTRAEMRERLERAIRSDSD